MFTSFGVDQAIVSEEIYPISEPTTEANNTVSHLQPVIREPDGKTIIYARPRRNMNQARDQVNFLLLRAIIPGIRPAPLGLDCVLLLDERGVFVVAHVTALAPAPVRLVVFLVIHVVVGIDASLEFIPGIEDISRVLGQHFGCDVVEATRAAAPVPDAAVKRTEMR